MIQETSYRSVFLKIKDMSTGKFKGSLHTVSRVVISKEGSTTVLTLMHLADITSMRTLGKFDEDYFPIAEKG